MQMRAAACGLGARNPFVTLAECAEGVSYFFVEGCMHMFLKHDVTLKNSGVGSQKSLPANRLCPK